MVRLIKTLAELSAARKNISCNIGLVPTMGNLHHGHLSLIEKASKDNAYVIITIFVNPKQFGPNEDYDKYPRTIETDLEKISSLNLSAEVIVFAPSSIEEIYPKGFQTVISVNEKFQTKLCSISRPDLFSGVTTVVYRLFSITRPSCAYFGQKDYQQFAIISQMTKDLELPIQLFMLPIIRGPSGLALSSRNQFLNSNEKNDALALNSKLNFIKKIIEQDYFKNITARLESEISSTMTDYRWEYLEVLDIDNLEQVSELTKKVIVAGAFKLGEIRLIDNLLIDINYG